MNSSSLAAPPRRYRRPDAVKASYGSSADVWLLGEDTVLKIFPRGYPERRIETEAAVLERLSSMAVPKILEISDTEYGKALVYSRVKGVHRMKADRRSLYGLGTFLREMHGICRNFDPGGDTLFSSESFESLLKRSSSKELKEAGREISFETEEDTVIHGDPFPDNALFRKDGSCAMVDFSTSCRGDSRFDLAVALFSWCMDGEKIDPIPAAHLLEGYGFEGETAELEKAVDYALLYYSLLRFERGMRWRELYEILKNRLKKRS